MRGAFFAAGLLVGLAAVSAGLRADPASPTAPSAPEVRAPVAPAKPAKPSQSTTKSKSTSGKIKAANEKKLVKPAAAATAPKPKAKAKAEDRPPLPPTPQLSAATLPNLLGLNERKTAAAALEAAEKGAAARAHELAALAGHPQVAELVDWLILSQPGTGAGFERIADFLSRHPEWPSVETLIRRAEDALDGTQTSARVIAWFGERDPMTANGRIRLGEALARIGRADEGRQLIRAGWVSGNFGVKDEKDTYRRIASLLTAEDHVARLDRLLWERQVDAARRMLPRVDSNHKAVAEARIGLITKAGNVDKLVARVPAEFAGHGGLTYDRLRWRREKGLDGKVEELLMDPPDDLGRAEKWWIERHWRARKALSEGRVSEAYRLAADHGPLEGRSLAEAEWLAGWIALRFLDDRRSAETHFLHVQNTVRFPVSRARGAYWIARAADANNERQRARQWYAEAARHPTTYYGQLALLNLGERGPLRLPADPEPSPEDRERFERRDLVLAARILAETGQDQRLRTFLLRLQGLAERTEEHALVTRLARDLGRIDLAVAVAKRSAQAGVPLIAYSYPVIEPIAQERSPEPPLLLAVSRQESEFNAGAVSSAGALGLMQLMPQTAREVARVMQVSYRRDQLTADPTYNVRLGSRYLGGLLDSWDGNYVLALAAYNAGEGRVRKWIREWGDPRRPDVDAIDWIELIPFSETRNYVQRVLESLQVYRQLLNPAASQALLLERDLGGRFRQESCNGC